jgi:probable FeS assembly SUF system protein SufT
MMHGNMYEEVTFTRECAGIIVPDGTETVIPEGMGGYITQLLGGHYTVMMGTGYLVRIDGQDADALGKEVIPAPPAKTDSQGNIVVDEEAVWDRLRTVYDPEIPVNIVELGLVYELSLEPMEDKTWTVTVQMTLTAPGCGMGQVLRDDVEQRLKDIPGIQDTEVDLVFEPAWGPERMSEAARLELGFE